MKTTPRKKMSVLLMLLALTSLFALRILPEGSFQAAMENDLIVSIQKKLKDYNSHLPEDRAYVQTDKPFYSPGDDIWFSALVREGTGLKPSLKSDILTVELISPKGTVEKRINLIARNGKTSGDFSIDPEAPGGLYKLRAYTNWMKNEGLENYFEKELQVQDIVLPHLKMKLDFEKKAFGAGDEVIAKLELNSNDNKALMNHAVKFTGSLQGVKLTEQTTSTDEEGITYLKFKLPTKLNSNDGLLNVMIDYNGSTESISRSIPIVLNKLKMTLYPEGGDLVNGLESKVAFRALNEFGKPADVEGVVVSEKGTQIATFKSFHQGMGAFSFLPQAGERYKVKITKPEGIKELYPMPEALDRGYVMNLNTTTKGQVGVSIQSTESEELSLVAQVRGKMVYSTIIRSLGGKNELVFSTEKFPVGVAQITLFDSRCIARAERLAFVNKDKHLTLSIETDKEKYQPREKVKMTFLVKDERGLPMPANLAVSVVNDQLLSFADDRSGNMLSQLLLQQDLKEKVDEPAFYFDPTQKKAAQALDYLLLTSGWRRFTWEKLLEEDLPSIQYFGQKTLLSGTVLDAHSGKALSSAKLKTPSGEEYATDAKGKFSLSKLDLFEPINLQISAEGFASQTQYVQDYQQNLVIYLYKNNERYIGRNRFEQEDEGLMMKEEMIPQAAPAGAAQNLMAVEIASSNKHIKRSAKVAPVAVKAVLPIAVKEKKINAQEALRLEPMAHGKALRDDNFGQEDLKEQNGMQVLANRYYRARVFYAPQYEKQETIETRTDFRNTIYWNPNIEIGYSGRKTIEFYASDDITSFRTTVEAISNDGSIGRTEQNFFTQLPFELSTKIPVQVATEDLISIPLTLKNNTNGPLGGSLTIQAPEGLQAIGKLPLEQTIMPGKAKTIYLDYKVLDKIGEAEFTISFQSCGLSDAFTQKIKIAPKGFPAQLSFSSQESEKEYAFELDHVVKGSLKVSLTAFPNVVSDLMTGVEGILQEPYGCFEQTSCTAYPNAMVLDYLKSTESKDRKTLARATDLLDRGYKRLTSFETSNKGYEWFGANPAHEGLTAYGIMEFVDMQKAGQAIDQTMLDRTVQWLLNHRDGKGGFERERRALHDFGRISDDVLNGYIVYALAEAGYSDIKKEFDYSFNKAMQSKDAYLLAMISNAAFSMKENSKGNEALKTLLSLQAKDGSFTGSSHSITYSQGNSLSIETSALSLMAILKSPAKNNEALTKSVQYLVGARSGSGVFSSTQGTILALKALTEYAKFSKKTTEDGTIAIYVDNKKVAEKNYKAGDKGAIIMDGLDQFIKGEGKHEIKVKYLNVKTPLPYSLAVNWNTSLPASDKECRIDLKTTLSAQQAFVGETVRLTATISNRSASEVASTMAILGIPAGLTAQAWQLKELLEKNVFDYYEIKGNSIAIYYRGLEGKAIKEINLDLKAEIPGKYDAPASSTYLYYTNEFKTWTALDRISIQKPVGK
jgi:hypothetical protein